MHSVNVHVNTRAKGNPMKAVRDGSIILRFEDLQAEIVPKVIERPGVFKYRNHRINLVGLVCVVMSEASRILTENFSG